LGAIDFDRVLPLPRPVLEAQCPLAGLIDLDDEAHPVRPLEGDRLAMCRF
jgi:hypothetical protein